ncbi:MAG: hypothetical protein ACYTGC_13125, partial [Planctomycetota bacterium]
MSARSTTGFLGGVAAVIGVAVAAPAVADEVELIGGDVLQGRILERSSDKVTIEHDILGPLTIRMIDVQRVGEDDPSREADPGEDLVARATLAPVSLSAVQDEPAEPAVEEEPPKEWTGGLTLGFNGSWGNTDTQSFNVSANATREVTGSRLLLDTAYFY